MQITKVTEEKRIKKNVYKIYIDEEFAFTLSNGELFRYHLKAGQEITQAQKEQIDEAILKKAKLYVMHLLKDMDRTKKALQDKLKEKGYREDIAAAALTYVEGFGYLNDREYAKRFVGYRMDKKSRREIEALMHGKGFSKDDISEALEECYEDEGDGELLAIAEHLRRRRYFEQEDDKKSRERTLMYLQRKGFSYDKIKKAIESAR
ncbi:regulatory protein [Lachnospiraceae bacterium PM6-15]|uniref:regulatory protein RecX n=1 Tax=Ohessyouella blattaphilus TaxID=2949333 RepID=UPI003E1DBDFA